MMESNRLTASAALIGLAILALACDSTEPNLPPTVTIESPADSAIFKEGQDIALQGTATDPEEGELPDSVLAWHSDIDGLIGSGSSATLVEGTPDLHTITFSAFDSEEDTGIATIRVRIKPNQPPTVAIVSPDSGFSVVEGSAVDFSAEISDPEQGTLPAGSVVWRSDRDGELGRGADISVSTLSVGDHEIRLTGTDERGLSSTDTIGVAIVPNQPPSVAIESPADGAIFEFGSTIEFRGVVADVEDGSIPDASVVWESHVDGQFGNGPALASEALGIGVHTVRLTATDSHGDPGSAAISINITAPAPTPGFRIDLRFLSSATSDQMLAFTEAQARWGELITGDVDDNPLSLSAGACGISSPAIESVIDDVIIFVTIGPFDGPGGVLGAAGPCALRETGSLPIVGRMIFDVADVENLLASGRFDEVILHEMGHVIGIGTIWRRLDLLDGAGGPDPVFTGPRAVAAFDSIGGIDFDGSPVPVENTGGSGTRDSHWRESVFDNELMTGFLDSGANPLSVVTVASLEDLGYAVDLSLSDPFTLTFPPPAGPDQPGLELRDVILTDPILVVDRFGVARPVQR